MTVVMTDKLTNDNFVLFAMHHYDNPQCHSLEEFEEDLKKTKDTIDIYLREQLRYHLDVTK